MKNISITRNGNLIAQIFIENEEYKGIVEDGYEVEIDGEMLKNVTPSQININNTGVINIEMGISK